MPPLTRAAWSPQKNNRACVDVSPHQHLAPQQNPPFHIANADSQDSSSHSSPNVFERASPSSSTSSLTQDADSHSERPSSSGKRDGSWIARPRNCFMIFRCQYSCENRREGKRVRRPRGSQPEKSLSKRAAEAWHELSTEKKEYFQALATKEASEHARLHPGYRFKPARRSMGRRRTVHSSSHQHDKRSYPPAPSETKQGFLSTTQAETPPQPMHVHLVKSSCNRSSSVPPPTEEFAPSNADLSETIHRKSRSFTEDWVGIMPNLSSPVRWFDEDSFPFTEEYLPPSGMHVHEPFDSVMTSPNTPITEYTTVGGYWSPVASSSSLDNWNGVHASGQAALRPWVQHTGMLASPLSPLPGTEFDNPLAQLPHYHNPAVYAHASSQIHIQHLSTTELWVQQMSQQAGPMGEHGDPLSYMYGANSNGVTINSAGQLMPGYDIGFDPASHRPLNADAHPVYWA